VPSDRKIAVNPTIAFTTVSYSETDSIRGITKKHIVAFQQKPYRFEKLIAEIRAALVDSPKT
jgi:hypothetical protein